MSEWRGQTELDIRDSFHYCGRGIPRLEQTGLVDHRPTRERAGVATADEYPGCFAGRDAVSSGHWQLHVVCKVFEVIDGLLDRVHLKRLHGEVVVRVGVAIESVLKNDSRRVLLLGNLAVDSRVCQVAIIA